MDHLEATCDVEDLAVGEPLPHRDGRERVGPEEAGHHPGEQERLVALGRVTGLGEPGIVLVDPELESGLLGHVRGSSRVVRVRVGEQQPGHVGWA